MRLMLLIVSLMLLLISVMSICKNYCEKQQAHNELVKAAYLLDQQPPAAGDLK